MSLLPKRAYTVMPHGIRRTLRFSVRIVKDLGTITVSLVHGVVVGREVREQMFDKVASLLHDLDEGMRPLSVIAPYFPTAYHRKRDK